MSEPIESGTELVNEFPDKLSFCNRVKLDNELGIGPVKKLLERSSVWR